MPYHEGTQTFVNPYHFLSLARKLEKTIKYRDQKRVGTLTGWIECELQTKTPIFIPNTTKVFAKKVGESEMKCYDFFSYTDLSQSSIAQLADAPETAPVIPGSELRGMIRSAFEAVTKSCLSTTDDTQKLYKRTTNVGKPGILIFKNNTWKIQCCEERIGIAFKSTPGDPHNFSADIQRLEEGAKVFIRIGQRYRTRGVDIFRVVDDIQSTPKDSSYVEGYLHKGEPFGRRKHHESVFVPTGTMIDVDERTVQNVLENFKLYRDQTVNIHLKQRKGATAKEHSGYRHVGKLEKISDLHGKLIYYAKRNNRYYLCPAAIGREVFHNRLTDILPKEARPCQDIEKLCEACALFGVVGTDERVEQKHRAAASRVRFTDALADRYEFDSPKTLHELASPKPSATEFYLKKTIPNADLWNYDYAGKWRRKPDGKVTNTWEDLGAYAPEIRGRKFYWHQQHPSPYLPSEQSATERHVHIRPLKSGTFTFKVYFNNISREDLDKLLWVLEIGGRKTHAHKLGMGKPLGLGSVQITVTSITQRTVLMKDNTVQYDAVSLATPKYADVEKRLTEKAVCDEFLKITDFDHAPKAVQYPQNQDSPESYKWFMANKQIGTAGTQPIIHQELPSIHLPHLKKYYETARP